MRQLQAEAYAAEVKFSVLGVRPGPVVTAEAAAAMAAGVARLLAADVAVAVTGVGGPEPAEGQPAGTVWMAVHVASAPDDRSRTRRDRFEGEPPDVCSGTVETALRMLQEAVASVPSPTPA